VSSTATAQRPRPRSRSLARLLTEMFAPPSVVAALLVLVALHSTSSSVDALHWGSIAVLFAALIPVTYIVRGVRRQYLSDHHVQAREQRPGVVLVAVASVIVGLALFALLGAPRDLFALVAGMAVGLAASLAVTMVWKISTHVAVVTGAVVILGLTFGTPYLALLPAVVLVGWARVGIGDHKPTQVVAGPCSAAPSPRSSFLSSAKRRFQ
jgi:hypothetical protein